MLSLMCNCPEIQEGHVFRIGDYIYDTGTRFYFYCHHPSALKPDGIFIWIPTQEQVQDSLRYKLECSANDVRRSFIDFYITHGTYKQHWTDRELWIDFYVYKVFNKYWREGAKRWDESKIIKK